MNIVHYLHCQLEQREVRVQPHTGSYCLNTLASWEAVDSLYREMSPHSAACSMVGLMRHDPFWILCHPPQTLNMNDVSRSEHVMQ